MTDHARPSDLLGKVATGVGLVLIVVGTLAPLYAQDQWYDELARLRAAKAGVFNHAHEQMVRELERKPDEATARAIVKSYEDRREFIRASNREAAEALTHVRVRAYDLSHCILFGTVLLVVAVADSVRRSALVREGLTVLEVDAKRWAIAVASLEEEKLRLEIELLRARQPVARPPQPRQPNSQRARRRPGFGTVRG